MFIVNPMPPQISGERSGKLKHACWSGVLTFAMKRAGVTAAVIESPATDLSEIVRTDMPISCRGASPITTNSLAMRAPSTCRSASAARRSSPGDAVLCDESGIVVLRPATAEAYVRRAMRRSNRSWCRWIGCAGGEMLPDISGATALVEGNLIKS